MSRPAAVQGAGGPEHVAPIEELFAEYDSAQAAQARGAGGAGARGARGEE